MLSAEKLPTELQYLYEFFYHKVHGGFSRRTHRA